MPTAKAMAEAVKAVILRRFTSDVDNGGEAPIESLLRAIRQHPSTSINPNQLFTPTNSLGDQLSASTKPPSTSELADQLLHEAIVCARIKIRTSYSSSTSSSALEALLFAVNGNGGEDTAEASTKDDILLQILETLAGKSPPTAEYFDDAVASWVDKLLSSNQGEEEDLFSAVQVSSSGNLPAKWVVPGKLNRAFDQSPPPTILTDIAVDTFIDTIQSLPLSNPATTWALAERLVRACDLRPTPDMVADIFMRAFADAAEQLAAACFLSADQATAALHAALNRSPADDKHELRQYLALVGEKLRPPPTASDEVFKSVVLRVTKAIMSSNPRNTPIFAFYSAACKLPDDIKESPAEIDKLVDQFVFSTNLPTMIEQFKLYGGDDLEGPSSHHTQPLNAEQFISFFKIDDDNPPMLPSTFTTSDHDLAGDKLVATAFTNAAEEMMKTVSRSLRPWTSPRHALLAGVIDFLEKESRFPAMEAIQLLLRRDTNSPATVDEALRKAALSSITSPSFDGPVEDLLSAIEETLSEHDEEGTKLAVYERLILSTVPIGRRPGSKFLINGFVRAIEEEWSGEPPELVVIAAGVGRVKGMEDEKVKEVVMGALGVAWRRWADGEGAMDEDGVDVDDGVDGGGIPLWLGAMDIDDHEFDSEFAFKCDIIASDDDDDEDDVDDGPSSLPLQPNLSAAIEDEDDDEYDDEYDGEDDGEEDDDEFSLPPVPSKTAFKMKFKVTKA